MENENAKTYTLRGLTAEDMFPMCNIIAKIGVKEFTNCFRSPDVSRAISGAKTEDGARDINAVGVAVLMDIVGIVVSNISKAKDDIYTLLSQLSGMTKREISALPMAVFFQMVVDVLKKDEFKDFFTVAYSLLK